MQESTTPHVKLEGRIGSGLDVDLIARACEKYKDAKVSPSSTLIENKKPIYDWLEADDPLYKEIADSWIKHHLDSVASRKRVVKQTPAILRTNATSHPFVFESGIMEEDGLVVMIPLSQWSADNGSFVNETIERGEYFVIDGMRKTIASAAKGGLLLIYLFLTLEER